MKGCQTLATLTFFMVANLVCITGSAVPPGGSAGAAPRPFSGGLFQAIWRSGARDADAVRFSDYVNADGRPVVIPAGYGPPMVAGQGARQNVGGVVPAGYAYGPAGCGCASCGPGCGSASCGCGGGPGVFPCEGYCGASPVCNPYAAGPGVYGPCPPPGTCPPYGCGGEAQLCGAGCLGLDQWGPHYFDARIEAVAMTRTRTFEPYQEFAQKGIVPDSPPALDSDQLQYDFEPGFRIVGRYDLGPLAVFEVGYTGIYGFDSSAKITADPGDLFPDGEGDLYSLWSGIFCKNSPQFVPPSIPTPEGPHAATERSLSQSIRIRSDLQTAEMSYRRYWVGYTPKISGTFLTGIRYTRITEDFLYHTEGGQFENSGGATDTGEMDYDLETQNNLLGFQTGGDMWITIRQGLRIGGETKVGIYGNHHKVHTNIDVYGDTSELIPDFSPGGDDEADFDEEFSGNRVAFIGEASLDVVFDLSPSWSLRAGYEVLFASSLALAGGNFNNGNIYDVTPVDGCPPVRSPFSNSNGTALYHGGHVGVEYIW